MSRQPQENVVRSSEVPKTQPAVEEQLNHLKSSVPARPQARRSKWLCLILLSLLFFTPLIQFVFSPFPKTKIFGLPNIGKPRLKVASVLDGSFQRRAEQWYLKRGGLYGYMVRASNELTYRVFGQISSNYGSTVLVGKEHHLYQPMYLNSYNKTAVPAHESLVSRVRAIKKFQDLLTERGIATTLLLSSNFLTLYPELVPAAYRDPSRQTRKNSYEIMRPLFDTYGVDYIDGHELLQSMKSEYPFRLFQTTASHWNDVAACRVTQLLTQRLDGQLKQTLPTIACEPVVVESEPRTPDLDLLEVTNLLFPKRTYLPAPYVELPDSDKELAADQPRMLFVGTSFCFSVLSQLRRHGITTEFKHFLYYQHWRDSKLRSGQLRSWEVDWEGDVFKNDVIVIEANTANVGVVGFNFLWDALQRLEKK